MADRDAIVEAAEGIDWSAQHCGVHQGTIGAVRELMPDLVPLLATFPDDPGAFTWDIKVHMLMPRQYPCIPNWHQDNVPRVGGIQRFDLITPGAPMWCWISGPPLTEFEDGFLVPYHWHRFTQLDRHRGTAAGDFCWRAFIRATHSSIVPPRADGRFLRRHCQVYTTEDYKW